MPHSLSNKSIRETLAASHVSIAAVVAGGAIVGGILTVLLAGVSYAIWQTVVGLTLAGALAATVVRLGGGLLASLVAGLSITVVPIYTSWSTAPHGGSTLLEEIHVFVWTAWQYPVIFLPAAVAGFSAGASWLARTSDTRDRDWVLSLTVAGIVLTAFVWMVWFYWFNAESLMAPGRPPA